MFPGDILKLFWNKNVGSPKVGLHLSQYFDSKWCQDEIQITLRFSHYVKCHRCQHTFFSFLRIWMVFWKSPFAYFLFKVIFRRNCASDIWQHFIPFRILILKKCKRQKVFKMGQSEIWKPGSVLKTYPQFELYTVAISTSCTTRLS